MTNQSMSADDYVQSINGFDNPEMTLQCGLLAYYLLNYANVVEVIGAALCSLRSALHLPAYSCTSAYLSENATRPRRKPKPKYVKLRSVYALGLG